MRLEKRTHEETYTVLGEFGPGYDTTTTVEEFFIHPESATEKQELFDLIQGIRNDTEILKSRISDCCKKRINQLQSEMDEGYKEYLAKWKSVGNFRKFFMAQPDREICSTSVDDLMKKHFKGILEVINYILDTDNFHLFYTPLTQELYEGIIQFDKNMVLSLQPLKKRYYGYN